MTQNQPPITPIAEHASIHLTPGRTTFHGGLAVRLRSVLDHDFRKLIRNSGWIVSGGMFTTLLSIALALMLPRALGAESYGLLALIMGASALVFQFADFRTWEVMIKLFPERVQEGENGEAAFPLIYALLLADVLAGLVALALIAATSLLLARYMAHDDGLAPLIMLFAFSLPLTLLANGVLVGVMRVLDRFSLLAAKSVVMAVAQFALVIGVALAGGSLREIILALITAEGLNAVASVVLVAVLLRQRFGHLARPSLRAIVAELGRVKIMLWQYWLSGTIKGLQMRIDIPLLGALTGPIQVSYYRIANDLAFSLAKLGTPIQSSILPILVDQDLQGNPARVRRLITQTVLLLGIFLAPILIAMVFFAPNLLALTSGEEFRPAALPLILLAFGIGVNTLLAWARPLLVARGLVGAGNGITFTSFLLEIALFLLLVPSYKAIGAAAATAVMYVFTSLASAYISLFPHRLARRND